MATNPFNVQAIAQANTPFLANNGNPGTVYNIPRTGGYVPPQADANNNWAVNPFSNMYLPQFQSQYANNQFWNMPNTGTPTGPRFTMTPFTGGGGVPWAPPPVVTPPPTTPPPTTPPIVQPPQEVPIPWENEGGPGGGGLGGGSTGLDWVDLGSGLGNVDMGGTNNPNTQVITPGLLESNPNLNNLLNMVTTTDGKPDWKQIIDMVSEPWIQGNLYMENSGTWNAQNIVKSLANTLIPGVGSLLAFLADKGVFGQTIKTWFFEGKVKEAMDKLQKDFDDNKSKLEREAEERANAENPFNDGYTPGEGGGSASGDVGGISIVGGGGGGRGGGTPTVDVAPPVQIE